MGDYLKDIRFGVRMLLKRPGLTLASLLCLALGTGSTVTVFTMVNATLIRPLPYEEPDRITWLMETAPQRGMEWLGISYPNFRDWQQQNTSFKYLAAYQYTNLTLSSGEDPRVVKAIATTADMFRILGIEPFMGRHFHRDDDLAGAQRVVMLSYGLWQGQFGGDPDIIGSSINMHGDPHTAIGVMPAGFAFPEFTEVWVPMSRYTGLEIRGQKSLQAIGRLKDGVSLELARAEMETIQNNLREEYPENNFDTGVRVIPLTKYMTEGFRDQFWMLLVSVGLVLLIACANVANLLLARATVRNREIAIRCTLGAPRARLVKQLLTESVMLGVAGGVLGLLVGKAGIAWTLSIVPVDIPYWMEFTTDLSVIVFLLLVSIFTGVVFGLAPISQAIRMQLTASLKEGGSRSAGTSRHILRNSLIVGEVSLALVLLVGASLLIQGYMRLLDVAPGFEADGVLAMKINLPESQYPEAEDREFFYHQVLEKLSALPGVTLAGASLTLPMSGMNWGNGYSVEDYPTEPDEPLQIGNYRAVHGAYFEVMQIPLLSGRTFTEAQIREGGNVVIINETFARRYWPDANPIGKRLILGRGGTDDTQWYEILGVVGDVRHYGLGRDIRPGFYFPYARGYYQYMHLVVRTLSDPAMLVEPVRSAIWSIDPGLPINNLRPMSEIVAESTWSELIFTRMLSAFAVLALLLAMLGVYGIISYATTERTREIGIRIALGARPSGVIGMVIMQGMRVVSLGVLIGLAGSVGISAVMVSLFYGVSLFEPVPLIAMVLLLILAALLAVFIPAYRVSKQDPVSALRYE